MTSPSIAPGVLGAAREVLPPVLYLLSKGSFWRPPGDPVLFTPLAEEDASGSSATRTYLCCWGPDTITSGNTGMLCAGSRPKIQLRLLIWPCWQHTKLAHLHVGAKHLGEHRSQWLCMLCSIGFLLVECHGGTPQHHPPGIQGSLALQHFLSKHVQCVTMCPSAQMPFVQPFLTGGSSKTWLMDPMRLQALQGFQLHPGLSPILVHLGSCQAPTD